MQSIMCPVLRICLLLSLLGTIVPRHLLPPAAGCSSLSAHPSSLASQATLSQVSGACPTKASFLPGLMALDIS